MFEERRLKAHQRLDTLINRPSPLHRHLRAHGGHRNSNVDLAVGQVPQHEFVFFGGMNADGMLKFHIHKDALSLDQAQVWLQEQGLWRDNYQVEGIRWRLSNRSRKFCRISAKTRI
jgi:hypothetical protein